MSKRFHYRLLVYNLKSFPDAKLLRWFPHALEWAIYKSGARIFFVCFFPPSANKLMVIDLIVCDWYSVCFSKTRWKAQSRSVCINWRWQDSARQPLGHLLCSIWMRCVRVCSHEVTREHTHKVTMLGSPCNEVLGFFFFLLSVIAKQTCHGTGRIREQTVGNDTSPFCYHDK